MIRQLIKTRRRQVLIDISTQKDFFLANGKACIRNHRRVLANLRRVMAWARHNNLPIISTCQVYPNQNGCSEISYCLDGTEGQRKIRYTLVDNRITFPADGSTDLPVDLLKRYHQIILHKRCTDPFDEPRIERLLTDLRANEFIIVGANAEDAVLATALGLVAAIPAVVIYNHFSRQIAAYKALVGDTAAAILRLISRDLSRYAVQGQMPLDKE